MNNNRYDPDHEPRNGSGAICPICFSNQTTLFLKLVDLPIHCHIHVTNREAAFHMPKGDIYLTHCSTCDHVFNQVFDPSRMEYDQGYENSLHFSPHFQEYASSLALRLIQTYDVHHKQIVEIGCGKGEFLTMICELGQNRGVGFDPSLGADHSQYQLNQHVTVRKDYYTEKHADLAADVIVCRHVLEHIQYPHDFLMNIRKTLDPLRPTVLYFEVPNSAFTLKELGIWDFIYEHCSYFSAKSLECLFRSCGFQVHQCKESFHGQYLGIEVTLNPDVTQTDLISTDHCENLQIDVQHFSDTFHSRMNQWRKEVATSSENGDRMVVWGAGSKGVTFLNALNIRHEIEYVIDINPRKQGNYITGTGQKIVSPEFLAEYQPTHVVVMNSVYLEEINLMLKNMHIQAQVISV
jgi:SAM-dependent methyltransferase